MTIFLHLIRPQMPSNRLSLFANIVFPSGLLYSVAASFALHTTPIACTTGMGSNVLFRSKLMFMFFPGFFRSMKGGRESDVELCKACLCFLLHEKDTEDIMYFPKIDCPFTLISTITSKRDHESL